jgi:hypothetical protein
MYAQKMLPHARLLSKLGILKKASERHFCTLMGLGETISVSLRTMN